jgi:hypothetical protein
MLRCFCEKRFWQTQKQKLLWQQTAKAPTHDIFSTQHITA